MGTVVIVCDQGCFPKWIKNVINIPYPDMTNVASTNTYRKILKACQSPLLSEDFLLSNDDFFLNSDFDANTFPYYHRGELQLHIDNPKATPYPLSKMNTAQVLTQLGKPLLHYGVHCPMRMNKKSFIEITSIFDWKVKGGYLTRCLYGNMNGIPSTNIKDFQISNHLEVVELEQMIKDKPFFAVKDSGVTRPTIQFLKELYPNKSRFEND